MPGYFPFAFVFSSLSILLAPAMLVCLHWRPFASRPASLEHREAGGSTSVEVHGVGVGNVQVFWQRSSSHPPYSSSLTYTWHLCFHLRKAGCVVVGSLWGVFVPRRGRSLQPVDLDCEYCVGPNRPTLSPNVI